MLNHYKCWHLTTFLHYKPSIYMCNCVYIHTLNVVWKSSVCIYYLFYLIFMFLFIYNIPFSIYFCYYFPWAFRVCLLSVCLSLSIEICYMLCYKHNCDDGHIHIATNSVLALFREWHYIVYECFDSFNEKEMS